MRRPSLSFWRERRSRHRARTAIAGAVALIAAFVPLSVLSAPSVSASAGTGTGISYTLEGCRGSTGAYVLGTYRCPDTSYTTGNLGKGWNELDLVPGRVTLTAGNTHPVDESYAFVVAVDNLGSGSPGYYGYDRLSDLTLNPDLSTTGVQPTIDVSGPLYTAGSGSVAQSLYRLVTVSNQPPNSTLVFDFYARLALGSHNFPGSSLHFNLWNSSLNTQGIGSKEVSIPVKEIEAPGFTKSQSSTTGSSVHWTVDKSTGADQVNFPNTCSTTGPTQYPVDVTVTWTKSTVNSGDITVDALISVTNNAHREIDVSVSDQLYNGATPVSGSENTNSTPLSPIVTSGGGLNLAAGATYSFHDVWSVPAGTDSAFSDIATATFTDPVFGNEVVGTLQQTASSTVQTVTDGSGNTATLQDIESMTGSTDFNFSVNSVTETNVSGSFDSYTLGTATRGPVTWNSGTLSESGSVVFHKTVFVLNPTVGSATLSDTATLSPADQESTTDSATTTVSGSALVSVTISKTTNLALSSDRTFTFNASAPDAEPGVYAGSTTITIPAGSTGPETGTITGLDPNTSYTIDEPAVAPFPGQNLTGVEVDLPNCSTTLNVVNTASPPTTTTTVPPTTTTVPPTTTTVPPTTTTVPPTTTTTPPAPAPELTVVKGSTPASGSTVNIGDTVIYTLTLSNAGDAPATNVTVTDTVPTGATYMRGSASCNGISGCSVSVQNGTITWSGITVAAATNASDPGTASVTFEVEVAQGDINNQVITNLARFSNENTPGCTSSTCETNKVTVIVSVPQTAPATGGTTTPPSTTTPATTVPPTTTTPEQSAPVVSPAPVTKPATPKPTPKPVEVPGATAVHTGMPWAGSQPIELALLIAGSLAAGTGEILRRRNRRLAGR